MALGEAETERDETAAPSGGTASRNAAAAAGNGNGAAHGKVSFKDAVKSIQMGRQMRGGIIVRG